MADAPRPGVAAAAAHALGWLAVANVVGLLLATLLLVPGLNRVIGPMTYGRWVPVHLDLQLYGWTALPLVALLFHLFMPRRGGERLARAALGFWSGALAAAAVWTLLGHSTGKLFLEPSGPARLAFVGALVALEGVLVAGFLRRRRQEGAGASGPVAVARPALLVALAGVPIALAFAGRADVYPPIDPTTGGPTGTSLLGSSLAIVAIVLLVPPALGLVRRHRPRWHRWVPALAVLHLVAFLALGHAERSHRDPIEIAALLSVLPWAPVLASWTLAWRWPRPARRWLGALAAWALLLAGHGVVVFLPGVLDRVKFTNVLVGHSHLAMAGMVTAFGALLLATLLADAPAGRALAAGRPFVAWQVGTLVHIAAVTAAGLAEISRPGAAFAGELAVWYALRLVGGLAMTSASIAWAAGALRGLGSAAEARSVPAEPAVAAGEAA